MRAHFIERIAMTKNAAQGRGEADPPPASGYPSAYDIPKFKKMAAELAGLKLLLFLSPKLRGQMKELEAELERIVGTVERFYQVLGERHWVFHDNLGLDPLVEAVSTGDADVAEAALIAQYRDEDRMRWVLLRTKSVSALRPRADLIDAAWRDYQEGRYYSVVLVLLSVMDGFVNDVGQQRRGLHTRDGEELVAWDSVTAHHQGLAATQASFTKSFKKTSAEPVFELYRNGIVHGNLTNFDNLVVASKAWNRLFALVDWSHALEEAARPEPPSPSWTDTLKKLADNARQQKVMDKWVPRAASVAADGAEAVLSEPVVQAATAMLKAWKTRNYGKLAPFLHEFTKAKSRGAFIGDIRKRFEVSPLDDYEVIRVEMRGPGVAHVWVTLTVAGEAQESEVRWLRVDEDQHVRTETDSRGAWQTIQTDPLAIIGRAW